jgi:hypothetical protein
MGELQYAQTSGATRIFFYLFVILLCKFSYCCTIHLTVCQTTFEIPFSTSQSIIPSATTYLNKLNVMRIRQSSVKEDVLMQRLSHYVTGISNKDVFSLYPQNNLTAKMFNFLLGW